MAKVDVGRFISRFPESWLAAHDTLPPWELTARSSDLIARRIGDLGDAYRIDGTVAIHRRATVESGAVIKGPAMVGPDCYIAAGAYLRGGCWLEEACIVGPGSELKSSYLFKGAKLAHFNFVGDSLIGAGVNCEAGAIIANHRNECADPRIVLILDGAPVATGASKFGAIVGDGSSIGANAVIAPGALIAQATVVPRLGLVDQSPRVGPDTHR